MQTQVHMWTCSPTVYIVTGTWGLLFWGVGELFLFCFFVGWLVFCFGVLVLFFCYCSILFVFFHFVSVAWLLFNLKRNLCFILDSNFSGWSISQNLSKKLIVTANTVGHSWVLGPLLCLLHELLKNGIINNGTILLHPAVDKETETQGD